MRLAQHKLAAELILLAAIGLFLGLIGPFGTEGPPDLAYLAYWQINIVGGGLIGIAIDAALKRAVTGDWPRVVAVALLMTPAVALLVFGSMAVTLGHRHLVDWPNYVGLLWQVFVVALPVMALRLVAWRRPERIVEQRTIVEPPLPAAEAAFRRRLSAKRRAAQLIAIEAQDHYLMVHTDAGEELVTMRFSDAIDELKAAHGYRVHRGWWVSAAAIETVRWRRGSGAAKLHCGMTVPVSRTYAPLLREAGWL